MNDFKLELTKTGAVSNFYYKNVLINLIELSSVDNSIMNVYIRGENDYFGILDSNIEKTISDDFVIKGQHDGIEFRMQFDFHNDGVFTITVDTNKETEIIYATDICLGDSGSRNKSAYTSQYIDNRVFETENGFTVAMRRTTGQSMGFPFGQFGSNKKVVEYATEGYDFFDTTSRIDNKPKLIAKLPSRERNYEYAFVALKVFEKEVTFYGKILEDKPSAITQIEEISIPNITKREGSGTTRPTYIKRLLNGKQLTSNELKARYEVLSPEYLNDELISFFQADYSHVVTQAKELLTDRTHASIITSGNHSIDNSMQLVDTNYMNGVFSAQLAVSNTGINKLNANIITSLYLNQFEGMRIFVKNEGEYQMLNLPSTYELAFNYSKWTYVLDNNEIIVTAYTEVDAPNINFEVAASNPIEILITDNIDSTFTRDDLLFKVKEDTLQANKYPHLKYEYVGEFTETNENVLGLEEQNIIQLQAKVSGTFEYRVLATTEEAFKITMVDFDSAIEAYNQYLNKLKNGIEIEGDKKEAFEWNTTIHWYLSNGLIHFATPHGVEQHGGAAWGTRDVCQGPVELYASLGHYDKVREILLEVFKNQSLQTKNWPQWFMFDNYHEIRADEAHGDIIVWPMKALADYLTESGDIKILDCKLPYYDEEAKQFTNELTTLRQHVLDEIQYIKDNFAGNTYLSQYADGDWDDTLQPFNEEDRKLMVSGWTTALTYQALRMIAPFMEEQTQELRDLAVNIKADYYQYIIKDGVASGFIKIHENGEIDYLLHPSDNTTGIKYRLLPMNRGMISGLFETPEIAAHYDLINSKLKCPDGVRLMDKPAPYHGGVNTIFQRAESASTVGREVSLQYVHAHIRYVEAMCTIGKAEEAYSGLKIINPVMVNELLDTANLRQRNSYFSSSEGDFNNRYEYEQQFNKLYSKEIPIKSGWRIYSSGPGIYLKQLLTNFYGRQYKNGQLEINKGLSKQATTSHLK